MAIVLVVVAIGTVVVWWTTAGGHARPAQTAHVSGALPTGSLAALQVAGALAIGPTGSLYIADVAAHRVLVRLSDGRFRVVAGSGEPGYSGNRGPALSARLSTVSDLAFSPTGSLFIVDGGRVRVIDPKGVIRTVAGNGRAAGRIAFGTPARSAALGTAGQNAGPSIAVARNGELYIATAHQLLRLTGRGTLDPVADLATTWPFHGSLDGLGRIAVDAQGDIDVSGVDGWSVWQVTPNGRAHALSPGSGARESGGGYSILQRAPGGTVYAENGPTILRITQHGLVPAFRINRVNGEYFWPTYFAFGEHGETYVDEIPGDSGFEAHQRLIATHAGHLTVLWHETNHGDQDSFGSK